MIKGCPQNLPDLANFVDTNLIIWSSILNCKQKAVLKRCQILLSFVDKFEYLDLRWYPQSLINNFFI